MELSEYAVPALDEEAMAAAFARHQTLTKPAGALGKLEGLSVWLAGVQGACPPQPLQQRRLVLFCGDHGVAAHDVSAYPAAVTQQMVGNFLAGGAASTVLAALANVSVRVLDIAVDGDVAGVDAMHKVRRGSGAIHREPALSADEVQQAFNAGLAVAEEESGADVLIAGDMGIGNSTIAAAITCAMTNREPVEAVGRGTGVDDFAWARKVAVVRDALRRSRAHHLAPLPLLAEIGGADVAAMSGFLIGCAQHRRPVVLDGILPCAAALLAVRMAPGALSYFVAGHRSADTCHAAALSALQLDPLLDLGLRLGEGTGALLALPLLDAAVAILRDMATFSSAGVSDRA